MLVAVISVSGQSQRRASGIIYFTNNTPEDLRSFPVEILKGKKRMAVTYPDEHYRFAFFKPRGWQVSTATYMAETLRAIVQIGSQSAVDRTD